MLSHLSASQVERGKVKHRLVTGLESAKACEQGHLVIAPKRSSKSPPCSWDDTSQDRFWINVLGFCYPLMYPVSKFNSEKS